MTQANGPQKEGHQAMKVSSTLTQTITGKTRGSSGVGECVNTYGGPNFKKKTCNYSLSRIVAPGVTKTVQNMITMIERDGRKMLVINGESSTKWNRFKRAQ